MARLEKPRGLKINFKPSERQLEVWYALQPNHCDKCHGQLYMKPNGYDKNGHEVFIPACKECGNTDIPEQILSGGSAGGGKALILSALVCTPKGFKQLKDLKEGDMITDPMTGGAQYVEYLHPIETRDYYRISFIDGAESICSDNHLWRLHITSNSVGKRDIEGNRLPDRIWTAKHIYQWMQEKKAGQHNSANLTIPLTQPVKFNKETEIGGSLPIHPYFLGCLIGNGCFTEKAMQSGRVGLSTRDPEMVERIEQLGYTPCHIGRIDKVAPVYYYNNQSLMEGLYTLGLAHHGAPEKFIPEKYKYASIESRKLLMQGLTDTDGSVDDRGHISYTSISKQLIDDVAWIVRSLGGKATITSKIPTYRYKGEKREGQRAYTVYIMTKCDTELAYVPRKKSRCRDEYNGGYSELCRRIVDIEYIGKREGRCITVDQPHGLFLTDDFVVTHNSYLGCCWLTLSCMQFEGIRMVVARRVRKTLLETTWKTLKGVLHEWGLKQDVHYHINNQMYVVTFWNGSEIMAMELAPSPQDLDYNSLGSLEITGGFIDEVSEVPEKAVEVLTSRIRYKIAETFIVGKMLMSSNPALTWIRNTFVMTDDGEPVVLQPGYRYIPFSLFDNPNEQFRAIYYNKLIKLRNKADRDRLLYGNWLFTTSNKMAAYWNFDGDKHLIPNLQEKFYDPTKPLILSFDFNVNPYMTCLPIQIDYTNKIVYVFIEFIGYPKDKLNNTPAFTRHIAAKLVAQGHVGGVLLTGDPAGLARSTQTEEGVNNYTIASKNMDNAMLRPKVQLLSKQPAHTTRLEFINELLSDYHGWTIKMDARNHRLIDDMVYQKKNPDGTKEKKKVLNDNGDKVEKYGHCSDCLDYATIYYLNQEYTQYRSATTDIVTTIDMGETVYGDFDY